MKIALLAATIALIGSVVYAQKLNQQQQPSRTLTQHSGFYCNRLAISPERRKVHEELSHRLTAAKLGVRELDNGFEFEFPGDSSTVQAIGEWLPDERACCPFFDIAVRLEREGGKVWLGFSGREGVKTFIRAEFSPWFSE